MIEVQNVVKYYGDFLAVDEISFSIKKGEIVGLLGPNGAGKSTSIRMICGYLTPESGTVTINGMDSRKEPIEVKKIIGYLPESAPLYDEMLVFDYLTHVMQIRELPSGEMDKRLRETVEICGLTQVMHKNIGELSKGFRQRVGLAHALIGDPDILVLDEPTSGLDPNQIVEIRNLIKEIGKTKTIILCSHILSEVEATCDRIIIISQGKIVADSSKEELKRAYRGKTISLELDLPASQGELVKQELASVAGAAKISLDATQTHVAMKFHYESEEDIRREIYRRVMEKQWMVLDFHQEEKSLENIFRELTYKHPEEVVPEVEVDNVSLLKEGVADE